MSTTQIRKIMIEKFRALKDVEVDFGDRITVLCGKNGTSKSSILGIVAQIFSFEKDYTKNNELTYQQITGQNFKSQYSDHFRISKKFDPVGSISVHVDIIDGHTGKNATAKLELMKRGKFPRPVVRHNSTAIEGENSSRNFTHPVIFLSLKRLYPIADRDYKEIDFEYLNNNKSYFIGLTNELLNTQSSLATGTEGTIKSAVSHAANYNHESVSAGEDNAGQIILALMSFRKLKEEYSDYKGGLLLIDEADAGLFPAAQLNLIKIFDRECKDLNLQVIITSHSPTLIEYVYEQSQKYRRNYKIIYLSNTYGNVQVAQDWSWQKINADINTKTVSVNTDVRLPIVNVYFEDREAADFFAALMYRQPLKKFIKPLFDISMGCTNYLQLIQKKIPEFSERSLICLDSDVFPHVNGKSYKTVVLLPGHLPPDQLIFEHLYNLPAAHEYWNNDFQFTRAVFTNSSSDIIREYSINGNNINISDIIRSYKDARNLNNSENKKKAREIFKNFYNDYEFQKVIKTKIYLSSNPWKNWIDTNPELANDFMEKFQVAMRHVLKNAFSVDVAKLTALKVNLKKTT